MKPLKKSQPNVDPSTSIIAFVLFVPYVLFVARFILIFFVARFA
jgi:hypothetical protein